MADLFYADRAKVNGQREVRENIRDAMRRLGLSQRAAAEAAGISRNHLVAGLSFRGWLTREAVAALAVALEMSFDEIVGGSIFADDHSRFGEFQQHPPEWAERDRRREQHRLRRIEKLREETAQPTRALCCECGALRAATIDAVDLAKAERGVALSKSLHCGACGAETTHALLRLATDPALDADEAADHVPSAEQQARDKLQVEVDRLFGFNVDVIWQTCSPKRRRAGFHYGIDYDESKSRWRIEVDPNLPTTMKLKAIESAWCFIADGDFDDLDWDVKATGAIWKLDNWFGDAMAELVEDVERFLDVEKRRTALHYRDQVEQPADDPERAS